MYSQVIASKIRRIKVGEPFKGSRLAGVAPQDSVRKTLSALVESGVLMRVSRGVYVRPEISRHAGIVPPSSEKILKVVAEGEKIAMTGAEAAQRLGLTTQMVLKEIYLTSGRSRTIKLEDGRTIVLRHASPKKMILSGRLAGVALSALLWMGKNEVTEDTINYLRQKLPRREFLALGKAAPSMPTWLRDKFLPKKTKKEKK